MNDNLQTENPFTSVIIADSLTNDFMGRGAPFLESRVHIGVGESERLLGNGAGILPTFLWEALATKQAGRPTAVILVRDCHDPDDPEQQPELLRYGKHNLIGSSGVEYIDSVRPMLPWVEQLDTTSLSLPLDSLREIMSRLLGKDFLALDRTERNNIHFTLLGCHTDKRVLGTATLLRNVLGFPHVAVSPHLVGSSNHDAHMNTLQGVLPDILVQIFPDLQAMASFAGLDPAKFTHFKCSGAKLQPEKVTTALSSPQKNILDLAFMRFSAVELIPLSGGFSGSLLLLAKPRLAGVEAAPVVVKIDHHGAIQRELDGYDRVKAIFGSHIPTFNRPISVGNLTGIVMELACRSGVPKTLQSYLEGVTAESAEGFLKLFNNLLNLLQERLYRPTCHPTRFSPWQQFGLHNHQQYLWLMDNIGHIVGHNHWQGGDLDLQPGVTIPDFTHQFLALTADPEWEMGTFCLGHGDLNLANVILDDLDNMWLIDWTHSEQNPLEQDLAKLENDVKFVTSKNFIAEDLPALHKMESFFIHHLLLPPWEEAAATLAFVQTDLRFRLMYQIVANIRQVYGALNPDHNPKFYHIALLRYATHTLSFDARRHRGECSLHQLRHALLSVHHLVKQLGAEG